MQLFDSMCRGLEFSEDGVSLRPKIKEMYEKTPSWGSMDVFWNLYTILGDLPLMVNLKLLYTK